jgi:hypothetical protein
MSGQVGYRDTITSNLVLNLDAGNYKSYPGTGTTWTDLSQYNSNGTLTNGPTFNSSNGGSIVFDGTNDFVLLKSGAALLTQTSNITMEVWFYKTGTGLNYRLFYNGNSGANGYGFYTGVCSTPTTLLGILFGGVACNVVSTTVAINRWYHAVFTNTSVNVNTLYLNGASVSTATQTYAAPTTETTIGAATSTGNAYNGRIAIAKLYNRALTATEVLQNYNSTKARFGL